jgi:hypothetical protein
MSGVLPQILIVIAFAAFCFGSGYLAGFIVTRKYRPLQLDERQMGMGRAAERFVILSARPPLPSAMV